MSSCRNQGRQCAKVIAFIARQLAWLGLCGERFRTLVSRFTSGGSAKMLLNAELSNAQFETGQRLADDWAGWHPEMWRVLVIDGNHGSRASLGGLLQSVGFRMVAVPDAAAGVTAATDPDVDIVLLNFSWDNAGIDTLRSIRSKTTIPVIVLGERGSQDNCAASLDIGADDYAVRPFSEKELKARINAVLRRHKRATEPMRSLAAGKLRLVPSTREVTIENAPLRLTSCQFDLLEVLLRSGKAVATKDYLYMVVLGRKRVAFDRSIDNHVSHLRKKLHEVSKRSVDIETIHGIGYRLAVQA
jgi:DNA-binding response OmpR family regulator